MEVQKLGSACPDTIKLYVESVANTEGITNYNVNVRKILTKGASYLATLYEVDIKGKTIEGIKEINIFIKYIPTLDTLSEFLPITDAYKLESYFYKDLSIIFNNLQTGANMPEEERFNVVKGYEVSDSAAIVLENVRINGFTTCHRMDTVSLKFAELSIEQLAKYHSLSFVIKKKMPDYFEKHITTTKGAIKYTDVWIENCMPLAKNAIRNLDAGKKKKIEGRLYNYFQTYKQYMEDTDSTICCLCHGDFRSSNILLKEFEGEIQKLVVVDYQMIHYGSPVYDFMFFIYLGTDKEFRDQYLDHLKQLYRSTMEKFLKYFDIDIEEVYPKKTFENVLQNRRDQALMIALHFFTIFFVPEDNVPDMAVDKVMNDIKIDLSPEIQKRFVEIVDEFLI